MTEISFPKSFSVDSLARKPSFTLQNPLNTCPHFALAQFSTHTFLAEFLEKYSLGKVLGHGACSIVCLATLNNSNESQSNESDELFAVKFIQKDRIPISKWTRDRKLGGSVPLEISILSRIQHPNIIKFIEYFEDEKFIYLVTEAFCDAESPKIEDLPSLESPNSISIPTRKRASSSSLVAERRGSAIDLWEATATKKLPVDQVKCIARQLADALVYLHSLKIAHGDIKLENILIDSNSKVKIIDFGGAVIFDGIYSFYSFQKIYQYLPSISWER